MVSRKISDVDNRIKTLNAIENSIFNMRRPQRSIGRPGGQKTAFEMVADVDGSIEAFLPITF